jgi:hypothetical protein
MDALMRPNDFACAMQAHWTNPNTLKNVSSPALMDLWTVMAETFNKAIEGNVAAENPFRDNPEQGKWMVLSPATGSGKTQGIRLYSAMQAMANLHRPCTDKVGILIVTREIEQADELARDVRASFEEIRSGGSTLYESIRGSTPERDFGCSARGPSAPLQCPRGHPRGHEAGHCAGGLPRILRPSPR